MIVLVATIIVDARAGSGLRGQEIATLALAVLVTLVGNWLLLHRRFSPLDELISDMEKADLAAPRRQRRRPAGSGSAELRRLEAAFDRMISRLETERRRAGRQAIQAQERERRRIAQDLHDEVNQALTAISLRLQASLEQAPAPLRRELLETKRLSGHAMDELLSLARTLRPAVLDDHGLVAALASQVRDFGERTSIVATFTVSGQQVPLSPEQQLVIYRVAQESLSNVVQHSRARHARVELFFGERIVLCVTDDGEGFRTDRHQRSGPPEGSVHGLGLPGMRERALLIGAHVDVSSAPGEGTRIELTIDQAGSLLDQEAACAS